MNAVQDTAKLKLDVGTDVLAQKIAAREPATSPSGAVAAGWTIEQAPDIAPGAVELKFEPGTARDAAEQVQVSFAKFTFTDVASGNKFCWDLAAAKGC